jgi:hypothetical protein
LGNYKTIYNYFLNIFYSVTLGTDFIISFTAFLCEGGILSFLGLPFSSSVSFRFFCIHSRAFSFFKTHSNFRRTTYKHAIDTLTNVVDEYITVLTPLQKFIDKYRDTM